MGKYICATAICCLLVIAPASGYGNETALRAALQVNYDRYARPAHPTNVTVLYSIRALKNLDITTESMEHAAYIRLEWDDPRLTWNPTQYANITSIVVNWCWRPEFFLGNSASDVPLLGYDDDETRVHIFYTGEVMWALYRSLETHCDVNIADFPFDKQTCDVELGFLDHNDGTDIVFNIPEAQIDKAFYLENGEWIITGSSHEILKWSLCCPALKPTAVKFYISFRRRQPYYIINIILPIVLLSFCVPWAFFITTESGERLGYALTMLLSYFVFLTVTSEMMPSTSLKVPVLAQYLLVVLLLCTLALICVAIQVKLYFMESTPSRFAKSLFKVLRAIMGVDCCKNKHKSPIRPVSSKSFKKPLPTEEEGYGSSSSTPDLEETVTWKCISTVIDRFLFYLYHIAVMVSNFALLLALYA